MAPEPEKEARETIDKLLTQAGWLVCDADQASISNRFCANPMPRIAVTVDMIATGNDIKVVEVVMFMRAVKFRAFFEQMKGRGVRVMKADDLHKEVKLCRLQYQNLYSKNGISVSPKRRNSSVTAY